MSLQWGSGIPREQSITFQEGPGLELVQSLHLVLTGPPGFSWKLIAGAVVSDRGGGTVAASLGDWYLCQPRPNC